MYIILNITIDGIVIILKQYKVNDL